MVQYLGITPDAVKQNDGNNINYCPRGAQKLFFHIFILA
jgi:hypothetical protein